MDRTATLVAAWLLLVGAAAIFIGVGTGPERAPDTDTGPTFFGPQPAEASFDPAAGSIRETVFSADPGPARRSGIVVLTGEDFLGEFHLTMKPAGADPALIVCDANGEFEWLGQDSDFVLALPLVAELVGVEPASVSVRHRKPDGTDRTTLVVPADVETLVVTVAVEPFLSVHPTLVATGELEKDIAVRAYYNGEQWTIAQLDPTPDGVRRLPRAFLKGATNWSWLAEYDPNPDSGFGWEIPEPEELIRRLEPLVLPITVGERARLVIRSTAGLPLRDVREERGNFDLDGPHRDGTWSIRRPTTKYGPRIIAAGHLGADLTPEILAADPIVIELQPSIRLEVAVTNIEDARGWHAEVILDASMEKRNGRSRWARYHEVAGMPSDLETAKFMYFEDKREGWRFAIPADGEFAIDELPEGGGVEIRLYHLGTLIEQRRVNIPDGSGIVRVEFHTAAPESRVVAVRDRDGRPIRDATVVVQPERRGRDARFRYVYPTTVHSYVLAAEYRTSAEGTVTLPVASNHSEVVYFHKRGHADVVRTYAELAQSGWTVSLPEGRAVVLSVLGKDHKPLGGEGGMSGNYYSFPWVHIGHGVWRGPSEPDHPAAGADDIPEDVYLFAELPVGHVVFRVDDMGDFEFVHDTAVRRAECITPRSASDIPYGK